VQEVPDPSAGSARSKCRKCLIQVQEAVSTVSIWKDLGAEQCTLVSAPGAYSPGLAFGSVLAA
jgi:hypothetical protein